MIRRRLLALILLMAMGGVCPAHALTPAQRIILLSQPRPALTYNFVGASTLPASISFSRASTATDLVYTASSATYNAYASGVPRLTSQGFLLEAQRTNYLLNSTAPATQTVTLSAGTYATWIMGSGSVTTSAGTAVGTGFGAATQGSPNTITVSSGGTVVFTVSGTVTEEQCENGSNPSSFIVTAGSSVTRAADAATAALPQQFGAGLTIQASYITESTTGSGLGVASLGGDGSNNVELRILNGNGAGLFVNTGGTLNINQNFSGLSSPINAAASVAANSAALAVNGTLKYQSTSSGAIPSAANLNTLKLGDGYEAGETAFVFLRSVRLYTSPLGSSFITRLSGRPG